MQFSVLNFTIITLQYIVIIILGYTRLVEEAVYCEGVILRSALLIRLIVYEISIYMANMLTYILEKYLVKSLPDLKAGHLIYG